jgi:hypothetical protein
MSTTFNDSTFTYTITSPTTVSVGAYNASNISGSIVIPSTVTNNGTTYNVTSISYTGFINAVNITNIVLPETLTSIGYYAFFNCNKLNNFTIPNSVTSFGDNCFNNCTSITSIIIPNSVTTILGKNTFANCSALTYVQLPTNSTYTYLNDSMFSQCTSLSSITLPNNIIGINGNCFQYCSKLISINLNNVISIGSQCFQYCTLLPNVTLSPNVTYIGYNCFVNCLAFTSFTFPSNITTIAAGLIQNCQNIVSVSIPNGVIEMQDGVFYGCSKLATINLPSTLQRIGSQCFSVTAITSIILPDSLTTTNNPIRVFQYCINLNNVTFPNNPNFKSIQSWFQNTGFIQLTNIPNTVTNITGCVSYSTNITTFVCPTNLTSIGDNTFLNCTSLTNVILNNNLTTIGAAVFQGCSKLISITIPSNITSIGGGSCFSGMSKLTVTFQGNSTAINNMSVTDGTFVPSYIASDTKFIFTNPNVSSTSITGSQLKTNYPTQVSNATYVPTTPTGFSYNSVTNVLSWNDSTGATSYTISYGTTDGSNYNLGPISISSTSYTLTELQLGTYYFVIKSNNSAGSSVNSDQISVIINYISNNLIYKLTNTNSVTVSAYNKSVISGNIIIPSTIINNGTTYNVTSIEANGFSGSTGLTSITIPNSIVNIYDSAFSGCSSLNTIKGPFGKVILQNMFSLSLFTLDNSQGTLTVVSNIFQYCDSLTTLIFLDGVTTIEGNTIFSLIPTITTVIIPGSVINIGSNVFNNVNINFSGSPSEINNMILTSTTFSGVIHFIFSNILDRNDILSTSSLSTNFQTLVSSADLGCFLKGSKVLTKNGMIPIQNLKKNDLVQTLSNGFISIKFVGKTYFFNQLTEERINAHLYRLNKKDFPELFEDLYITGGHPLLVDDKDLDEETKKKLLDMIDYGTPIITEGKYRVFACVHPKAELWNDEGLKEIYDIVLENDDPHRNYGIYVNGILTESMDEHFFLNYSKMTEINKE